MPPPPRYSNRALPHYRYVPGQSPHPLRHPEGHAFGSVEFELDSFEPARWQSSVEYLYGVDLFNYAYWWEAHESFEVLWRAAGRRSGTGIFLQGLIQVAAGLLKEFMGVQHAALRLSTAGCAKIRSANGIFLGIEVERFAADVDAHFLRNSRASPQLRLIAEKHGRRQQALRSG